MSTSISRIMCMVLCMLWLMSFFFQDMIQADVHHINSQDFWADDSNSGSIDQPLKTISEGLRRAQPGDTILVAPGTYREKLEPARGGNSPEEAILLKAETSGSVFVMGSDIVTGWEPAFDQVWVKYGWAYNSQQVYAGGVQLEQIGANSIYHSMSLEGGNALPVTGSDISDMFPGSFWYDTKVGDLYVWLPDGASPQECVMEVSVRPHIMSSQEMDHIHVEGLVFAHSSTGTSDEEISMVNVSGDSWRFKDNYFLSADMSGLTLSGRNHHLENNSFILNGLAGFYIWGSETQAEEGQNIIISGNETSHNNTRGFHFLLNPGGASLTNGCRQVEIDRHLAWRNNMFGLAVDSDCANVVISRSFFSDNVIALYSSAVSDLYADNNIFSDNVYAMGLDSLADSHFSFNTFHANHYGIQLMDSSAGNPGNFNNHLNNNVFSDNFYTDVGIYDPEILTRDNSFNFNAYVRADFDMLNIFSDALGFPKLTTSLAEFQNQTGFDQNSVISSSIWEADEYKFFPPADSVLVNAGQYLNLDVSTDFYGMERPYGSGPDMGAVEYRSDEDLGDYPHDLETSAPSIPEQPAEPDMWTLEVSVSGQGQVILDPKQDEYMDGAIVDLQASAAEGWYFMQWSGDVSGSETFVSLNMDGDKNVSAQFERLYTLDISVDGQGSVGITPDFDHYEAGETVELSASTAEDWRFVQWGGDIVGSDTPVGLVMDADKSVSALFERLYTLDISVEGQGSVILSPERDQYESGQSVELEAVAADGWEFSGWNGDASGTDISIDLVMDADKSVSGVFEEVPDPEAEEEVYVFDPNAFDTGYNPVGDIFIQRRPGSSDFGADTGIVETGTPVGSKVMHFANDQNNNWNDGGDRWLLWNEISPDFEEMEFLYLFRRSHARYTELLGCMRMSGEGELDTYATGLRNNPDEIRGRRLLGNDSFINAGAVNHNLSSDTVNDWIWVRGRMDSGLHTIRARTWLHGDQEPDGWMFEWTDQDAGIDAGGAGLEVYLRQAGDSIDLAWWSVGTNGALVPVPDDVARTEPESEPEPDATFPAEVYGDYFDPAWAEAEPGLIRDLSYGDPSEWPAVDGNDERIVIMNQERVELRDLQRAIYWNRAQDKYQTTFILIRNCEEVLLENLHFLQLEPEYRGSHTIIVEDSGRVILRDSSFHGAVHLYHVRMEGNQEIIIENVEVSGFDYGDGLVRTGGGIWIENGDEGRGGIGVESMRSPNPRNLEWFQITNSYFHDNYSNPDNRNHDGVLIHSGSNGLVYKNLFHDWVRRDAAFDVSHRRWQDEEYVEKRIRVEENLFTNNHYIKSPGRSISENRVEYVNNTFIDSTFASYHHGYQVIFEENHFEGSFLPTFYALWGLTGTVNLRNNRFVFDDLHSFTREGGAGTDQDHTYIRLENNTYYVGKLSWWLNGIDVSAATWEQWMALGLDTGSLLKDISEWQE